METQTLLNKYNNAVMATATETLNDIYIAAPFFDDVPGTIPGQLDRVDSVKKILEFNPTVGEIFSPKDHQSPVTPMFSKEWRNDTFDSDVLHVQNADVIVAIMAFNENGSLDDGVAFEIGMAFTLGIPVVFIGEGHEDLNTNLMIAESGKAFLKDPLSLINYDFNLLPSNSYNGNVL